MRRLLLNYNGHNLVKISSGFMGENITISHDTGLMSDNIKSITKKQLSFYGLIGYLNICILRLRWGVGC